MNKLQGFSFEYLDSLFAYDPASGAIARKVARSREMAGVAPTQLDHIDNNRRNNAIDNLREPSQRQNVGNIAPPSHNTSGYKGVSKNSRTGLWHVQIKNLGKQTFIARDICPHTATLLYNVHAAEHFGEFAKFNLLGNFKQCSSSPVNTKN